jgi:signal transduction histidine kinase
MPNVFLRSTPFRLTLVLGVAFLAALVIAGAIAFQLIRQELDARIDRSVADTFTVISESYGENDVTDLIDSVNSHVGATLQHDRVYALADRSGQLLAGNVTAIPAGVGRASVSAKSLGVTDAPDDYRTYVGEVGEYLLLVGSSFGETNAIGRLTFSSLAWAAALFVAIVVATGLVVAARGQRRLDSIAETMQRVGRGELGARVAASGRGDDIDALVTDVNTALDRLSALVEGMRQVSVDIAHDLKTPLNRLAITVEAALEADDAGKPAAAFLIEAEEETRRINATFDALLRIAQIEAGARRARFAGIDPGELLATIADAYGEVAVESGQTLRLASAPSLPQVNGDRDLLVQMLANLVENAIRHCPAGTVIGLTGRAVEGRLEIVVADTGPGIPGDEREKVFRRLYRVEKSRTTPGSGLGLSLVRAIAELHGATITLGDNAPGLVVTIRFPATPSFPSTNL